MKAKKAKEEKKSKGGILDGDDSSSSDSDSDSDSGTPYTIHLTPSTLCTIHLTPYTMHPTPYRKR
jgi:hypothetical protein